MLASEPFLIFGHWRYTPASGTLQSLHDADDIRVLEPRLHALLNCFLEHPNTILSKDQLLQLVWKELEVSDAAVMRAIGMLRKTLDDPSRDPIFIETLSKRGYRWLAQISEENPDKNQPVDMPALMPIQFAGQHNTPQFWPQPIEQKTAGKIQNPFLNKVNRVHLRVIERLVELRWRRYQYIMFFVSLMTVLSIVFFLLLVGIASFQRDYYLNYLSPQSGMDGFEQYPVIDDKNQQVFYQMKRSSMSYWHWQQHDFKNLRKVDFSERYSAMGSAVFHQERLIFPAVQNGRCQLYVWRWLDNESAKPVWPCSQLLPQNLAVKPPFLYIFDHKVIDDEIKYLVLRRLEFDNPNQDQTITYELNKNWRRPVAMIADKRWLYLLIQIDFTRSVLVQQSYDGQFSKQLAVFSKPVHHLSFWDRRHLLVVGQQLIQVVPLGFGRITDIVAPEGDWLSALRYHGRLLMTQQKEQNRAIYVLRSTLIDPTLANDTNDTLIEFDNSNRSEWMVSPLEQGMVYLSNRSEGYQLWMADHLRAQPILLSKLRHPPLITQLLWWQHQTHILSDGQLFTLSQDQRYLLPVKTGAKWMNRVAQCHGRLFWTELSDDGWALREYQVPNALMSDVVDIRCGPAGKLLLQRAQDTELVLWLPGQAAWESTGIRQNWRLQFADAWDSNDQGVWWFDAKSQQLKHYQWRHGLPMHQELIQSHPLTHAEQLTRLRLDLQGQLFLEFTQPRDSDIVWLQAGRD
jgi:DNA-binding winged helix-turn-helix (wHTH) protein